MENHDTIKARQSNSVYQVVWDGSGVDKGLTTTSHSYKISFNDTISSNHNVDIQHPSSSHPELVKDGNVQITDDSIIMDTTTEHIITEISSNDNFIEKRKTRKFKREKSDSDLLLTETKGIKIKKEKDVEGHSAVKKRFSRNWFNIPEFAKWLEESPIPGYAFCNICKKDLHPGKSELLKHANTAKHKKKVAAMGSGTKEDPIPQKIIDLRSDSVTTPNRDMRDAMKDAVVGDDEFGDDPTVKELEGNVASLLNKEAGLFVPSGTMANLICVLTHCWNRGSLVILGDQSYMYRSSQGSITELGSVSQRVVRNFPDGTFDLTELRNLLKNHGPSWPTTTLICIENTHTRMGGKALPLQWLNELGSMASEYSIPIHMDGARLLNAAAALGSSPAKLCFHTTSVSFCLDKALGAPAGCIIASSKDFIERASLVRKSLGGVIHQVGILAAAGLYGLNNLVPRVSKDHHNAIAIAKVVSASNSSAVTVDVSSVQTNIVHLLCDNIRVNPEQLCQRLAMVLQEESVELMESICVKTTPILPNIVRIMTHGDLTMEDIRTLTKKLQFVISEYDNFFIIEYEEDDKFIS